MITIVEIELPKFIDNFSIEFITDGEFRGKVEAAADIDNGTLKVTEALWHNLQQGCKRARFTIAHEIGHFFLKHEGVKRRDAKDNYLSTKTRIEENEANIFAALFLAPTELAQNCQNFEEISHKFQIGASAAENRFEELAHERRRLSGEQRPLPESVINFMDEVEKRGGFKFKSRPITKK